MLPGSAMVVLMPIFVVQVFGQVVKMHDPQMIMLGAGALCGDLLLILTGVLEKVLPRTALLAPHIYPEHGNLIY